MQRFTLTLFSALALFAGTAEAAPQITDGNGAHVISKGTVIVDFYATWCPACRDLEPVFDAFSVELAQSDLEVTAYKADIDECPDLSDAHEIEQIPTVIVFRHGKEVMRRTGALEKGALWQLVQSAANKEPVYQ